MRYVLGPTFAFTPTAPIADAASATGKLDPTIVHKGVAGSVATFTVAPYDLAKSNRLMEVRLYLVKDGDPAIPAGAAAYVASAFPFGHADVSGLTTGGDVPCNLPPVVLAPHKGQYVLGLDF